MKTKSRFTLALIAAAGVLLMTACSFSSDKADARIESSAQSSYVFKTFLQNDSIKINSKDGVVTLTGTVAESSHKDLAQDTVENLSGVKSVDNQLVVQKSAPPEHSDSWLIVKINTILLFHRNVSASDTKIYVENGNVILRGTASSLSQKELTTEYAKDIDGVKSVVNEMTIAPAKVPPEQTAGEMIDDASITAQIKVLLLSHHSTSAIKTTVHTQKGVVTVSGSVKNAAEKSLVGKLANDVKGVTSVVNNMTIAVPAVDTK
ncbi:MAG: BON domain-containing protein [Opitutales bacterium]